MSDLLIIYAARAFKLRNVCVHYTACAKPWLVGCGEERTLTVRFAKKALALIGVTSECSLCEKMVKEVFGRRLWAAALTGIPFAVYKMGFGWYEFHHDCPVIGVAAMAWGGLDIVLNVVALPFPKIVGVCVLANVGRWFDRLLGKLFWEGVLLSIDTIASFMIVSAMIWFGRVPLSPPWAADVWNLAVIGNVLSVGLEQLYRSIRQGREYVTLP